MTGYRKIYAKILIDDNVIPKSTDQIDYLAESLEALEEKGIYPENAFTWSPGLLKTPTSMTTRTEL